MPGDSRSPSREPAFPSPKSSKFQYINAAREAAHSPSSYADELSNPMRKEVRSSLARFEKQKADTEFFGDADAKISRHQYARNLVIFRNQLSRYHSLAVFVVSMLHDMRLQNNMDMTTMAAAGSWGLNLLAQEEVGGALDAISQALLPAIFCDYNPSNLPYASAAIQAQVQDPLVIQQNPYFTHSMYVEQVSLDHKNLTGMQQTISQMLKNSEGSRSFVLREIHAKRKRTMAYHFFSWRNITRQHRILSFTAEKRQQRYMKALSDLRLRWVFTSWKLQLEYSRGNFLTERLVEATQQLENAKNQFQLQCFRTDRLLQASKDAKEKADIAIAAEQGLKNRIAELENEIVERAEEYQKLLLSHTRDAFNLVKKYKSMTQLLLSIHPPIEGYIKSSELYKAPQYDDLFSDVKTEDPMRILIRWCNYAVSQIQGPTYQPFPTIGREFYSGEYYLIVLYFVFPEIVSLQPLRDSNLSYRYRRICEMLRECGLRYQLTVDDFSFSREDRIVVSLMELFRSYMALRVRDNTNDAIHKLLVAWDAATGARDKEEKAREKKEETQCGVLEIGEKVEEGITSPDEQEVSQADELEIDQFMSECECDLKEKQQFVIEQCLSDRQIAHDLKAVSHKAIALVHERERGAPVRLLADSSLSVFYKVPPKTLYDLQSALRMKSEEQLKEIVNGRLREILKARSDKLSRIYYFYAGENAKTISETDFWRFLETSLFIKESVDITKEKVAQIFNHVISPHLETAMKAARSGKADVDLETMMAIAEREVEIREVTPAQFVQLIIRIAVQTTNSLTDGVAHFIDTFTIPTTESLRPFIQDFYSLEVQLVIQHFSNDLLRVFFFYLKEQEQSKFARDRLIASQEGGRFGCLLSGRTYLMMLTDCRLLETFDETISEGSTTTTDSGEKVAAATRESIALPDQVISSLWKLKLVRSNAESLEVGNQHHQSNSPELTFSMFLESLGLLCQYWSPDPFVPLSRKLAAFIGHILRKLIKVHAASTLLLCFPPGISLEGGPHIDFSSNDP